MYWQSQVNYMIANLDDYTVEDHLVIMRGCFRARCWSQLRQLFDAVGYLMLYKEYKQLLGFAERKACDETIKAYSIGVAKWTKYRPFSHLFSKKS